MNHPHLKLFFLLSIPVIFGFPVLKSQDAREPNEELKNYIEKTFGFDHDLINGEQYYNKYYYIMNDPYFTGKTFVTGFVVQSGKTFSDQMINYDVYGQCLILQYEDLSGGIYLIILNPAQTEAFSLGSFSFEKRTLDEKGPLFYQVLNTKDLSLYIHWKKEILNLVNDRQFAYAFSKLQRNYFLEKDGKFISFRNRKSFLSLFEPAIQKPIKHYLRQHQISFKNATPHELIVLFEYISSTLSTSSGK